MVGRLYPTFKEWKPVAAGQTLAGAERVYILPLRNENLYLHSDWPATIICLYPTFKEWKLLRMFLFTYPITRLYPTFKEWKPSLSLSHSNESIFLFISYL